MFSLAVISPPFKDLVQNPVKLEQFAYLGNGQLHDTTVIKRELCSQQLLFFSYLYLFGKIIAIIIICLYDTYCTIWCII